MKKLKKFLPLIVGVLVLVILIAGRAWGLSQLPKDGRWPNVAGGMYDQPVVKDGLNYLVPPDELYENGLGKDGVPALNSPKFISVAEADDVLADEVEGIDVEVNGQHRFYSFQILNWHGLVNENFADKSLLVSYSTFCGSAVVYERHVSPTDIRQFGDAGVVYNNCSVLYDKTSKTLWNQATGVAIVGEDEKNVGLVLRRYSSTVMTWGDWKDANPNGEVLSTETGFVRDYRRHPYGNYDKAANMFFPVNKTDSRLPVKDLVYDLDSETGHVGATGKFLSFAKEPNYSLAGGMNDVPVTAFVDTNNAVHVYSRLVGDQWLTFIRENNEIKDKQTDSRWNTAGLAIKGKLRGKQLTEVFPSARYFAFSYVSQFPEATLLGAAEYDAAQKPEEKPAAVTDESTNINVGF